MNKRIISILAAFVVLLSSVPVLATDVRSNHVVVVVEENHSFESVINNSSMPYLNSLAAQYGLALRYYGNVHPSIGNYFMMTTGQLLTTADGWPGTVYADNIVRQIVHAGKTWKVYAQSLPSVGYIGPDQFPYVRHHNPMAYFSDVKNSQTERLRLVPSTEFANDVRNEHLPTLSFLIPDELHDAHSGSLSTADQWLKYKIAPLLANRVFQEDGILIITFDESNSTDLTHGGGHVATVVIGPKVIRRKKTTTFYQHQSLLRTIELALGLPTIAAAKTANSLDDFFF